MLFLNEYAALKSYVNGNRVNLMIPRIFSLSAILTLSCLGAVSSFSVTAQVPEQKVLQNAVQPQDLDPLIVLSYHEVVNHQQSLIPSYAISEEQFKSHLDWLTQNGYQFVSMDDVIAAEKGQKPLAKKSVLLTFDDGYTSFYDTVFPILKQRKIPAILAVVGSWLAPSSEQKIQFGDTSIARHQILSWQHLKQIQKSGLVEIASHSYDLHRGVLGNPQGNLQPAATTKRFDSVTQRYESDQDYVKRIQQDFTQNQRLFAKHGLQAPRAMVWPYGRYNQKTVQLAQQAGMPISLTLDDVGGHQRQLAGQLNRILIQHDTSVADLKNEINVRQQQLTDHHRAQKIMHVDLDYIYDPDPAQQERNLGILLDRIQAMNVNTVYLQAFSDPDGNGSADLVYFPNRFIPMREDLFNRVSWQIQTRTQVSRVYAWMPVYAWELPKENPVAKQLVHTQQAPKSKHLNMGYHRLSPYSKPAQDIIKGIYQDLAKSSSFNGIIFHDDATLSDYEDASPEALKAYKDVGLTGSLEDMRKNEQQLQKWTAFKTQTIDDFSMQLAEEVRYYHPFLMTARNLYAQVALSAYAENWYSQSLERSLQHYDFTAIMAMPYMEQVEDKDKFFRDLVNRVSKYPQGLQKTVFEIQAVDWRDNAQVSSDEMANTFKSLYQQGALHVGYYPDNPFKNHPDPQKLKAVFDTQPSGLIP